MAAGRNSTNRSTALSHLGLVLSAIYLNLTLDSVNGSEHHSYGGGYAPPMVVPPQMWPEFLTRLAIGGYSDQGGLGNYFNQNGATGFNTNNGFFDDLFARRNAYDYGKGYGAGVDYGRGGVQGGGYRDLGGRNKGHTASGFSNSYRKDESGDRSSYYDDGLGHKGTIRYGADDARFRDQGGSLGRGGFHNSNLNRYGTAARGRYGDALTYAQGNDRGAHFGGGRYGYARHGRLMPNKSTGLYVIPMPSTLFFDQTPPPL
ncbi:ctenidin-3 [Halyomorpha halys]|uniref:ctenidin-3 n=1 Tax=Halyomorpha halys TaxID=286706 RepID=UPI0006D50165|nr:glycine-rich cell wall structural protein 2-like [Halyomorpha halys]